MQNMTMIDMLIGLGIVVLCLVLSAFFSMTEAAILSISNLKAKHLQEKQGKKAEILSLWIKHPSYVLVALLICNNLINIFVSIFTDNLSQRIFGHSSIFAISIILTLVIVLFAEVIPKTIAKNFAADVVIPLLKIFKLLYVLIWPLTRLITFISNTVQKWIFKNYSNVSPPITKEELQFLIRVSEEEGVIPEQKHTMLAGIFELSKTPVREIMVPRPDVVAVHKKTKLVTAIEKFKETGFSRLPIYDDALDNVIGLIHVKDALFAIMTQENVLNPSFSNQFVTDLMRDVLCIPESRPIDQLFQDMTKQKQQFAIVIDEYGGTAGIVTMENIFEEIFGNVSDEYDTEEENIHKTDVKNQYIVDCKIHIDEFAEFFDLEIKDLRKNYTQEFDTLAGLILHHFGKIPRHKDKFLLANLQLEILEITKRRVCKVCVSLQSDQSK